MPRKGFIAKRDVLPDPMYNSKVVTKLINNVMEDGKKGVAQKICYDAFEIMAQKTGRDALEVFEEALNNVMPLLEVKARRIGGANYQVPIEVRPERRQTLGLRWILAAARKRGEKVMAERLAKGNRAKEIRKRQQEAYDKLMNNSVYSRVYGGDVGIGKEIYKDRVIFVIGSFYVYKKVIDILKR